MFSIELLHERRVAKPGPITYILCLIKKRGTR